MDPLVMRIPRPIRALLVKGIIVPRRKHRSAEAYRRIWTPEGSPLAAHTEALAKALQEQLGVPILHGSAYGKPTLEDAVREASASGDLPWIFVPLFPHYAGATRGTLERRFEQAARQAGLRTAGIVPPFYAAPPYIEALSRTAAPLLEEFRPDHLLFSFHGLPRRHARQDAAKGPEYDYVTQCRTTMELLIRALQWPKRKCSLAWQSRLGRGWLAPETRAELARLGQSGARRLAVIAPSFLADCLETLEELGIAGRAYFLGNGGQAFLLCPALNHAPCWVEGLSAIIDNYYKNAAL